MEWGKKASECKTVSNRRRALRKPLISKLFQISIPYFRHFLEERVGCWSLGELPSSQNPGVGGHSTILDPVPCKVIENWMGIVTPRKGPTPFLNQTHNPEFAPNRSLSIKISKRLYWKENFGHNKA
eukprot:scaffold3515_cov126-Cylindrotheca_fusiformis.AAC.30